MKYIAVAMGLCAFTYTGTAFAGPITEKLRSCLTIDDMTKERLDCYDAIVPPAPKPKPPPAKIITDCKFLKEEDERLKCFNRFLEMPQRPSATAVPRASAAVGGDIHSGFNARYSGTGSPAIVRPSIRPAYVRHGRGGCGSRGGAGYRLPNGRCAGRKH
jgi:hypothetical protein